MSIPMYLAVNWKESVNKGDGPAALGGFGFWEDGSLRAPEGSVPEAMMILDDAVLPLTAPKPEAVKALAKAGAQGCYMDFERPPGLAHDRILEALLPLLPAPPMVPEAYCSHSPGCLPTVRCPEPVNAWCPFCAAVRRRHPRGWALELIPWKKPGIGAELPPVLLSDSLCACRSEGGQLLYYDTRPTLRARLKAAEAQGCRQAVCPLSAWIGLPEGPL